MEYIFTTMTVLLFFSNKSEVSYLQILNTFADNDITNWLLIINCTLLTIILQSFQLYI